MDAKKSKTHRQLIQLSKYIWKNSPHIIELLCGTAAIVYSITVVYQNTVGNVLTRKKDFEKTRYRKFAP